MALSMSTARQGLFRALVRSTRLSNTTAATARRSLVSFPAAPRQQPQQQKEQVLRRAVAHQEWPALTLQQAQRRCFSAGGGKEDDSDDDFKPKRKAVSDDAGMVSDLIKKQV